MEQTGVDPAFSDASFDKVNAFSTDAFSFGEGPIPPPIEGDQTGQPVGGGIPHQGLLRLRRKGRFKLPREVAEVVAAVAARQAQTLVQDEQKRLDELFREITLRGLEYESRYLEALNIERQRLIDQEIGLLIKRKLDEGEVLMLLAAVAAVL